MPTKYPAQPVLPRTFFPSQTKPRGAPSLRPLQRWEAMLPSRPALRPANLPPTQGFERARLQPGRYDPDAHRALAPEEPTHATEETSGCPILSAFFAERVGGENVRCPRVAPGLWAVTWEPRRYVLTQFYLRRPSRDTTSRGGKRRSTKHLSIPKMGLSPSHNHFFVDCPPQYR
jgi:hypothetical protein